MKLASVRPIKSCFFNAKTFTYIFKELKLTSFAFIFAQRSAVSVTKGYLKDSL